MIGTKLVETESLYFGLAQLYLGDSGTHESSVIAVLSDSDYFGCSVKVSFDITRDLQEHYISQGGVKVLSDILLSASGLVVNTEFVELTEKNFSYSLGGDGSDTNILINLLTQPSALRAELVFTYPNKVNTMTLILPKVKVGTTSIPFVFQPEEPMEVPVKLTALKSTHANWDAEPFGKIIFE